MDSTTAYYTPLHRAVLYEKHSNIKALLDQGASPAARTHRADTPLHLTLASHRYMPGFRDYTILIDDRLFLLEENPFGSYGYSHCHIACMFGNLEIVRSFLDRGVDPDLHRIREPLCTTSWNEHLQHYETCLHIATYYGRSDVVQLLLERGANRNPRNLDMDTPLHNARYDRDGSATKLLLKHGADANARNRKDMTPLQVQCSRYQEYEVLKALLEAGADVNLVNRSGASILQDVIIGRNGDNRVRSLMFEHGISLEEAGFDLSSKNCMSIHAFEKFENMTKYRKVCRSELELMNQVRLDAKTTLRNALRIQDPRRLQRLAVNEEFGRIVADEAALGKKTYPTYGYLVRLQYRRGARIAEAVLALQKLCACIAKSDNGLPLECAEMVIYYLPYEDLWRVIQAASQ